METEIPTTEPYQDFLFAINSPVTRERYSTRLRAFFVHIGIEGATMEERCRRFVEKVKDSEENGNSKWAYICVIKFLQYQKDRCDRKKITGSTVRGYYKAVKLFPSVEDVKVINEMRGSGFGQYASTSPYLGGIQTSVTTGIVGDVVVSSLRRSFICCFCSQNR